MNIRDLSLLARRLSLERTMEVKEGLPYIDLNQYGVGKLLGQGSISEAYSIKVSSISDLAKRKIGEAGGKIITESTP
jgi:ribosomal protein L15